MNILICGTGYGAGNIGDDAILLGAIKILGALKNNYQVGTIFVEEKYAQSIIKDVDRYWYGGFKNTVSAIKWADYIILGGATLISENPHINYPIMHIVKIIKLAKAFNKPVAALGLGTSEIRTKKAKRHLEKYYKRYIDFITVRAHNNLVDCQKLGFDPARVKITADLAFSLADDVVRNTKPAKAKKWGICLVNEAKAEKYKIVDLFFDLLKEQRDIDAEGICSEVRKEAAYDYEVTKGLVDRLGGQQQIFCDPCHPLELIEKLGRYQLVITLRMHMLIFCAMLGVPCLAVVRERKTALMAEELGITSYYTLGEPEEKLQQLIKQYNSDPSTFIAGESKIKKLQDRAFENTGLLEKWFDTHERENIGIIKRVVLLLSAAGQSLYEKFGF